ncbi:hypothetical protein OG897_35825 [Streptomyces sp. NBC_00237]|uniref:hypothetical protein n=1 Tax=Streptomyces sp. NBC_00237 TaxID=2975687 RepID=UPI00225AC0F1|nr:hypothetical protein [Streptomyces sp. NBC_00237]MCX5206762.1 hypothetical protein [Streptomyces sp. NBC_00237]
MTRSLPAPHTVLGYRRDGRPIFPVLGASPEDESNDEHTVTLTQAKLNTLLAREKDQGGRAALRTLADKLGFPSTTDLTEYVTGQRQAEQEQLTESQRREQLLVEREKTAVAREAQALSRERDAARRALLAGVGALGRDLDDAVALLRVSDDADETAVGEAVADLKSRRPELFGPAQPGSPVLPAAPGGAPASVPPARPGAVDRKPGAAGVEMARRRGLLPAND